MVLLELNEDKRTVTPSPYVLQLGEFKELVDKSRNKGLDYDRVTRELSFIFHYVDPRSPYARFFDKNERFKQVKKSIFGEIEWRPDEVVKKCAEFYKQELLKSPSVTLLNAALKGAGKISEFLENVNLNEVDGRGRRVNDPKTIQVLIDKLGKSVDSIKELEKKVLEDDTINPNIRGGVRVTKYNA